MSKLIRNDVCSRGWCVILDTGEIRQALSSVRAWPAIHRCEAVAISWTRILEPKPNTLNGCGEGQPGRASSCYLFKFSESCQRNTELDDQRTVDKFRCSYEIYDMSRWFIFVRTWGTCIYRWKTRFPLATHWQVKCHLRMWDNHLPDQGWSFLGTSGHHPYVFGVQVATFPVVWRLRGFRTSRQTGRQAAWIPEQLRHIQPMMM